MGYDGGVTGLTTSVTDSKGNTYNKVTGMDIANGGGTLSLDCWWAIVTTGHTGASPTISVAFNDTLTNANIVVQVFNGFTGTPTLDQFQHSSNVSSTTVTSGTTPLIVNANELIVGGGVHASTVSAWTLGATYTNLTSSDIAARSAAMESKVVAIATTEVATFTLAAARVSIGGVVTFYDLVSAPSAAVTQVAATLTFTGGTQVVAAIRAAQVAQSAATLTFTGGTQVAITKAAIAQTAATLTFTGGTQTYTVVSSVAVAQTAATLTFTGGTQVVTASRLASAAQSAATLTFTGGTQAVASVRKAQVAQVGATLTFTGGTQAVATTRFVTVAQIAATLTFTGGTQSIIIMQGASLSQVAATLIFSGGIQFVESPPVWNYITLTVQSLVQIATGNDNPSATVASSAIIGTVNNPLSKLTAAGEIDSEIINSTNTNIKVTG